jgi:hypothetical protein
MPLTREQTKYRSTKDTVFLPTVAVDNNLGVSGSSVFSGPANFTNGLTVNSVFTIANAGSENPNFVMRGPGEQTFRFHNTNTSGTTRVSWKMASRLNSDWSWIWYTDSPSNGTNDLILQNLLGMVMSFGPDRTIQINGTLLKSQPVLDAAYTATTILTVANILKEILLATPTITITLTLPTGALMDAAFTGNIALYTDNGFEWSIINTGSQVTTVAAGVAHTIIGNTGVNNGQSARFRSVRRSTGTWVSYRI